MMASALVLGGSPLLRLALERRGGFRFQSLGGGGAPEPAKQVVIVLQAGSSVELLLAEALRAARRVWAGLAADCADLCLVVEDQIGSSRSLEALTRSLAREAGDDERPFRVNAILAPLGMAAERVADAIEFVISDDANFVSGAVLRLDPCDPAAVRSTAPVLVTGASEGIGAACAHRLASDGYEVIVTGRDPELTRAVADDIVRGGGVASSMVLDATVRDDWQRAVDRVGVLAGIVSNVGACRLGATAALDEDAVELMLQANVAAHAHALAVGLGAIEAGGRMVFTGSVAALKAASGNAAYSASKAAIADLIEGGAVQANARGVRLHTIHPGLVFNDNVRRTQGEAAAARLRDAVVGATPLRRFAVATDIAASMAALIRGRLALDPLSPLVCDGGFSA